MNLCGKLLTEREGKSIGLAFFLVVAIKSNLSTFAAAKILLFLLWGVEGLFFFSCFWVKAKLELVWTLKYSFWRFDSRFGVGGK